MFLLVPSSKTHWQMFLFVSGRHVSAHPAGHQHGASIQISINLGKKLLRVSCIRKIADLNFFGESLCIVTFFLFSDSGLSLLKIVDFYFDLFWMAWHWKPAIRREHYLYITVVPQVNDIIVFLPDREGMVFVFYMFVCSFLTDIYAYVGRFLNPYAKIRSIYWKLLNLLIPLISLWMRSSDWN